MRRTCSQLVLGLFAWFAHPMWSQTPPHYHIVKRVVFDSGNAELIAVDPGTRRLFADYRVMDIDDYRVVGSVPNHTGHGYAIAQALGRGIGRRGIIFDLRSLAAVSHVPVGGELVVYDSLSHRAFIVADTTSVIDVTDGTLVTRLPLGGNPAGGTGDNRGHVFLSAHNDNTIIAVDARSAAVLSRHTAPGCTGPQGMAVDVTHDRLFISCENNQLVILEATSGRVVATLATQGLAGSLAYDPDLRLLFHPNPNGTLTTVQEIDSDHFQILETVSTAGAEPMVALDSQTHRVFLYKRGDGLHLTITAMAPSASKVSISTAATHAPSQ